MSTISPALSNISRFWKRPDFCSLTTLLLIALSLAAPRSAAADQYHYQNALIGDRASGMGTAYTAIADDATGLYYNPAGIVYAQGKNISASVNAYYNFIKSYKGVIGGQDWDRKSSALLPNYFGLVQPLGKVKVGFSYAVPDTIKEDQDQVFTSFPSSSTVGRYVINFNNDDNTYNFGPSIAMELNNNLSVGATLYFHQRRNQWIMNQLVNFKDSTNEWSNQYYETNEKGLKPIIGVMWSPVKKLSLGMAVSKVFLYDVTTMGQIFCSDSTPGGCDKSTSTVDPFYPTLASQVQVVSNEKRKYPLNINFGAAYFASDELLLSGDIKYYSKVTDNISGDRESVINIALGAEYFLNSSTAVRCGLFTDMANTPDVVSDGFTMNQPEHVDLYGVSGSISSFTKNTSVTLGAAYIMGDGQSQIAIGSANVYDLEAVGWTVFLSSSYSY